jgi:30S ribosomal protein S31
MGKGDLKSRRGKLVNGSYGVRRRRDKDRPVIKPVVAEKGVKAEKEEKMPVAAKAATPKAKAAPRKKKEA